MADRSPNLSLLPDTSAANITTNERNSSAPKQGISYSSTNGRVDEDDKQIKQVEGKSRTAQKSPLQDDFSLLKKTDPLQEPVHNSHESPPSTAPSLSPTVSDASPSSIPSTAPSPSPTVSDASPSNSMEGTDFAVLGHIVQEETDVDTIHSALLKLKAHVDEGKHCGNYRTESGNVENHLIAANIKQ